MAQLGPSNQFRAPGSVGVAMTLGFLKEVATDEYEVVAKRSDATHVHALYSDDSIRVIPIADDPANIRHRIRGGNESLLYVVGDAVLAPWLERATAHWKAVDYSTGDLNDDSGNGHTAVLTGGIRPLAYDSAPYLYLPGTTGNYASTPDSATLDITGDIDVRVRVALNDYTPATAQMLVVKMTGAPQRSFYLHQLATGALRWVWSKDGTASLTATSSALLSAVATDGEPISIRCTMDVDNGAAGRTVRFYTSTDTDLATATWTELGVAQTSAGVTSIFSSTSPITIGIWGDFVTEPANGKIYRAQVYNGIDGPLVADFDPSLSEEPHTSFVASTGETWTINRSASGYYAAIVDADQFQLDGSNDYFAVATTPTGTLYVTRRDPGSSLTTDSISPDEPFAFGGATPADYYRGAVLGAAVIDQSLDASERAELQTELLTVA